jgi:uncharacterized protein
MMNKTKKMLKYAIILFFVSLISLTSAQTFPEQSSPPRLVNDFSGILDDNSRNQLEQTLVQFAKETTTQIAIVTLDDISGYDPSDYAFRLAESWGIGQKGKSNGILILIKPKSGNQKGEAFIAVGYGLEGVVPDAVARRIVENEMIPRFRENNYAGGLLAGVTVLTEITRGEYTADKYVERTGGAKGGAGLIFIIVIFIVVFVAVKGQKTQSSSIGKELPFWILLSMLGSGSRHSGSWDSFSSGSGSGGFGGFGGGSFGGGGAGGSW